MRPIAILIVLLLATACGTADSKTSTTTNTNVATDAGDASDAGSNNATSNNSAFAFDPGVEAERTLDSLSEEELAGACAASRVYETEAGVNAAECLLEGYTWAQLAESMDNTVLQQACTERFESCLANADATGGLPQWCGTTSNCTGTVSQAIACVIDAGQGLVTATAELPGCDEITFEDLELPQQIQLPPAPDCAALNATCDN